MTDENKLVSKLRMQLQSFCSQISTHLFKRKTNATNEKSKTTHKSLLTCNDVARILQLSHVSHKK